MNNKLITKNTKFSIFFTRIFDYLVSLDIYALVLAPIIGGIVFIIITAVIYIGITHGNNLIIWNRVIVSIGFFIMGFSGIFQIIKKELLIPIKKTNLTKTIAIINGILIVSSAWCVSILLQVLSILGQ
jgi:hypothetical protein